MTADLDVPGLDAATGREIHTLTGVDASALPVPGRSVVVAGSGGAGVSSVLAACAQLAPHLEIAEWRGTRTTESGTAHPGPAVALLVVDPSSGAGEEETQLLAALRREAGVVAVVCNKIDAYWDWPTALRRIRSVLDPAGRLPLFAVAATSGTGIGGLTGWLTAVTSSSGRVRRRVRQAGVALAAADAAGAPPLDDRTGRLGDLTERRRRIVAGRDRGRTERLAAARFECAAARSEVLDELGVTIRTLAAAAEARCDGIGAHEVPVYRAWLDTQLASAVIHIDRAVAARFTEAAAVSLAGLGSAPVVAAGAARVVSTAPVTAAGPRRGAEDAVFGLLGVSTGFGVGRAVASGASAMGAGPAVGWALTPLTVVVGLAIAVWVIGVRRTSAVRAQVRTVTATALAELRITCERHVAARSTSTELEVAGQIARHHDRLVRETTRRVAALDIEIGRCREPAADPARQRAVRALADRLAVLADPDTPDPEIQDPEIPEPGPPVRATLGTDDEEGR